MRIVLIAVDLDDAHAWLARQPAPPLDVVKVTRRSYYVARGIEADAVLITPAAEDLPADVLERLRANTLPCVMARR